MRNLAAELGYQGHQTSHRMAAEPLAGAGLARISHHLTVEARHRPAITALRLLAVLNVGVQVRPHYSRNAAPSGARLVLTGFSRTSPRHVVRKAVWRLQANRETKQGAKHPDRYAQFEKSTAMIRLFCERS